MAEKKKTNNLFIRGTASYPKTNKPVKFDQVAKRSVFDPDGTYEVNVIVTAEQKEKLEAKLRAFAAEKKLKKFKNDPFNEQMDEDGEPTGLWSVKAKQYGKNKDGSVKRIAHFDGAAKPLGKDFILTSGSEIILSAYPTVYEQLGGGVKLNINAIQVLKYVEYEGPNPFEAQEGAWTSDDEDEGDSEAPFDTDNGAEEDTDPTDF